MQTASAAYVDLSLLEFGEVAVKVVAHLFCYFLYAAFSVARVLKSYVHRDDVRSVVRKRGEGVVGTCGSHSVVEHHDFREFLAPLGIEPSHDLAGFLYAGTDGELEVYAYTSVVLSGEELCAHKFHQEEGTHEYAHTYNDGHGLVAHHLAEDVGVEVVKLIESFLNRNIECVVKLAVAVVESEPLAAEHRSERKCAGGGDYHHDGHHPSELTEEHSGHAGYECQREEHRYQSQCGGDYRYSHLIGAVHSRLFRVGSSFYVGCYVLEHHYGIVHNHTDRDGESQIGRAHV